MSIKRQVLQAVADAGKKGFTRAQAQRIIWMAQGHDPDKFVNRPGYYSTNFTAWKYQGLMIMKDRRWYITDFGIKYLNTPPSEWRKQLRIRRALKYYDLRDDHMRDRMELRKKIFKLQRAIHELTQKSKEIEMCYW